MIKWLGQWGLEFPSLHICKTKIKLGNNEEETEGKRERQHTSKN